MKTQVFKENRWLSTAPYQSMDSLVSHRYQLHTPIRTDRINFHSRNSSMFLFYRAITSHLRLGENATSTAD
ncbi:hypothetical protein HAX54_027672, partial [Datura stramonium]|nr:hypothetical protein [Datura stramonium]